MSTQNNTPALPVISEEQAATLTNALETVWRLLATHSVSNKFDVDGFAKADQTAKERVLGRAYPALQGRIKWLKEQEVAQFRAAVKEAISPHIDAARAEKAEYDMLSPTLKAKLGAFPTSVFVPVSSLADAFPGLDAPAQNKKLADMGYKLAKDAKGVFGVKVELPKSITESA